MKRILILLMLLTVFSCKNEEIITTTEFNLIQINSKTSFEGNYYVFSGKEGEEVFYHYYYQDKEGYIRFQKIRADDNRVLIKFSEKPKLITKHSSYYGTQYIILEVPETAIKKEIKL